MQLRPPVPRSNTDESPFGQHMPIGQRQWAEIRTRELALKVLRKHMLIVLQTLWWLLLLDFIGRHARPVSQRCCWLWLLAAK